MGDEQRGPEGDHEDGAEAAALRGRETIGNWSSAGLTGGQAFPTAGWRRNVAASYYIGPPLDRSEGRPCPRCLEPGIVVQAAHARWCKPDSEAARARKQAAKEERRAHRLAARAATEGLDGTSGESPATVRRRAARASGLTASDRRLLDSIRLYEILLRYGAVGTVRRASAG
ncbi:MAG: hypothetical protein U1F09_00020 [Steroidobacteraceae bacterium]